MRLGLKLLVFWMLASLLAIAVIGPQPGLGIALALAGGVALGGEAYGGQRARGDTQREARPASAAQEQEPGEPRDRD